MSPGGGYAYLTGIGADAAAVIDLKRPEPLRRTEAGRAPHGARFKPAREEGLRGGRRGE